MLVNVARTAFGSFARGCDATRPPLVWTDCPGGLVPTNQEGMMATRVDLSTFSIGTLDATLEATRRCPPARARKRGASLGGGSGERTAAFGWRQVRQGVVVSLRAR